MQNLEDVKQRFLINTLTVKDFAYYSNAPDGETAVSRLMIKKHAMEIPWVAGSTTVRNETTKAGALKSVLLLVNGPAPCDQCHYEYGLEVHRKWQQPGVLNDDLYPKSKTFGGVIEALQTTSGGQIADADKLTIENTIMAGIEGDQLGFSSTREPNIVHCKRLYIMTTAADATHQVNYTLAGVTATVVLNSGATVLTQVNDINADATMKLSLVAFAIDATHIAITSVNPGLNFTIDDGGGATTFSGITRYLWIYAKYEYIKFYLTFKPFGWATVTPFNLTILDNTSAAAGNSVFYISIANVGTASGNIANSATSITYAANIRGSSLSAVLYASSVLTAGSVYVYVYSGANELIIRSLGTAGVTVNKAYSGAGRWPSLTGWDVFREFINARGLGAQSNMAFLDQPDPTDSTIKWNKITLTFTQSVPALDGANHRDNHKQEVSIYIKQGLGATSLWDATNYIWESAADGAFTADSDINDLLAIWSGLTAGTINDATHWLTVV